MRHPKKTHKRKRGGFLEGILPASVTNLFASTPPPPEQVIKKPTQAATEVVEKSAKLANVEATQTPEGVPGSETSPDQAKLIGGRRRRKTRKHRRRSHRR
jgi:hypothetical protein